MNVNMTPLFIFALILFIFGASIVFPFRLKLYYSNTVIYLVPNGLTQRAGFTYPLGGTRDAAQASKMVDPADHQTRRVSFEAIQLARNTIQTVPDPLFFDWYKLRARVPLHHATPCFCRQFL
jgi:hypothetical protein